MSTGHAESLELRSVHVLLQTTYDDGKHEIQVVR